MEINLSGALWGVVGAVATMVVKYFVDQLMEKHKAELSLTAKRRERYYEKQTAVLSGTYERLTRCLLPFPLSYAIKKNNPEFYAEAIKELIDKSNEALKEFKSYYSENEIYIPKEMSVRVLHFFTRLSDIIVGSRFFPVTADSKYSDQELEAYETHEKITRIYFDRLREEFREFMVDGKVKPFKLDDIDPSTITVEG